MDEINNHAKGDRETNRVGAQTSGDEGQVGTVTIQIIVTLALLVEVGDSSLSKNAVYVVTALWLCA
jgi:hypothetical protein